MLGRLAVTLVAALAGALAAWAQTLSDYRAPNEFESAYVGLAAMLGDTQLCRKISPAALNRVRKPSLARSLCYYQTALATGEAGLCSDVVAVPPETGMMAWLDPARCHQQVGALAGLQRPAAPSVHLDAVLRAAGYVPSASPLTDLRELLADPESRAAFEARLANLPDFSSEAVATAGFSAAEAVREESWVLGRALRLCAAGRSEAECDEKALTLLREDGLRRAGLLPPASLSPYRRLTSIEAGFLYLASTLKDPALCDGVGGTALSVGWSDQAGLTFVPARSACRMRVAGLARDAAACIGVAPVTDPALDGERASEAACREAAASGDVLFPAPAREPEWSGVLGLIGFGEALQKDDRPGWSRLAARLSNARGDEHDVFRKRLRIAAGLYHVPAAEAGALRYSEADLQLRAHQAAATRFHCSLDWAEVRSREAGAGATDYWTPERPAFSLLNEAGFRVSEEDFRGRYMLAYFGFTYCPDVCPMSLATIRAALDDLGSEATSIQPVFFTLDARRDTAPVLADYVRRFGETFSGLTGTEEEISRAARSFNVYYFAGEVDGGYSVEHTSYFYLVDPSGETVKYFDYGTEPHDMAAELRAILSGEVPTPGGGARSTSRKMAGSGGG